MKVIKHKDGIYEVENFLTDEELRAIVESIKEDKFKEMHPGTTIQHLHYSLSFIREVSNRMMSYFENAKSYVPITNIRRLKTNEFMHPHGDNDTKDPKNEVIFGVVIYLNDDFLGGELKYSDIGFSIKPKSASMVVHSADIRHEVLQVKSGNRYCLTSFIYGDGSTKFKTNLLQ